METKNNLTSRSSAISRGMAFFIGGFSLLNIIGQLRYPGFDANHWWIDLRPAVPAITTSLLTVAAVLLIAYSIKPIMSEHRRTTTMVFTALLLIFSIWNIIHFYILLARATITSACPVAFSIFVTAALIIILTTMLIPRLQQGKAKLKKITFTATVLFCLTAFPIAQMFCFGKTDYRRTADIIVVFGARAYADGRCSHALADRVRTGCRLYLDGYAKKIIFSGGPGDGQIHETQAMKSLAVQLGIPPDKIIIDKLGINTQASVENTCEMFESSRINRVLAVSHFYHLPRIKMTYQRNNRQVYTVPAKESYILTEMPKYLAREICALWLYYLRPLIP